MEPVDRYIYENLMNGISIDLQIEQISKLMIGLTKNPDKNRVVQASKVYEMEYIFRAMLTEKSRQKIAKELRDHNRSNAKNSGASPTHNTTGSVRIRNVLKEKVAGS